MCHKVCDAHKLAHILELATKSYQPYHKLESRAFGSDHPLDRIDNFRQIRKHALSDASQARTQDSRIRSIHISQASLHIIRKQFRDSPNLVYDTNLSLLAGEHLLLMASHAKRQQQDTC